MKPIADWIRRKPISAFFVLTFAITWGLGFTYIAVLKHNQELWITFASIATCGPALAGIIVTAIGNRKPKSGNKGKRWIVFFIAIIAGGVVFNAFDYYINEAPFSIVGAVAILVLVVPPVAYVICGAFSRVPAVNSFLTSLINPRGSIGWSLIGLAFTPSLPRFFWCGSITAARAASWGLGLHMQPPPQSSTCSLFLTGVCLTS